MDVRKPIFDAVRAAKPGVFDDPGHIRALDALLDTFAVPREAGRRSINAAGLTLIKQFEGLMLTAYPDPATGGDPWTIGYGSTGSHVRKGLVITEAQADGLLMSDLRRFEDAVARLTAGHSTSDNQFSAMVSFAFNVGEGNLASSTLLKKHNAGDFAGAAAEFAKWNHGAGRVMDGLTRRRAAEAQLYRSVA